MRRLLGRIVFLTLALSVASDATLLCFDLDGHGPIGAEGSHAHSSAVDRSAPNPNSPMVTDAEVPHHPPCVDVGLDATAPSTVPGKDLAAARGSSVVETSSFVQHVSSGLGGARTHVSAADSVTLCSLRSSVLRI